MGRDKALLEWQGRSLLDVAVDTLAQVADQVFISSSNPLHTHPEAPRLPDALGDKGPLGGLASALAAVDCEWILLLPCDMPGMQAEALQALLTARLTEAEAVVFEHEGILQGQCGLYRKTLFSLAKQTLGSGDLSLRGFLGKLKCQRLVADHSRPWYAPALFQNINSEADWQAFKSP